jgi:hypothetical protein
MKKTVSIIIIFLSTFCYGQNDAVKEKIKDLNDLYGRRKFQKVEILSKEILNNQYGTPTNEDKCNVLALYTSLLIWDDYENRNYKLGYDYILDLLDLWKNGMNDFPLKDSNVVKINDLIKDLEKKHPELKTSVKENENNSVALIKTETVNKNAQINTIETSTTPKSTSDGKTVTLTVSGTGKTLEEARLNALRSAIEQAFGAFISSKTEILNDNLIKDEIVSIANGNIQKYDIVSQVELPNLGYAITLNATVSIDRLTSFAESKGVVIEFKGGMFAANIKLQKLNEKSEEIAVKQLIFVCFDILQKSIDFDLTVSEPVLEKDDTYKINFKISANLNKNYLEFINYLKKTLSNISLKPNESNDYYRIEKKTFNLKIDDKIYRLRSLESYALIYKLLRGSQPLTHCFKIDSEIGIIKYNYYQDRFSYENDKTPLLLNAFKIQNSIFHYIRKDGYGKQIGNDSDEEIEKILNRSNVVKHSIWRNFSNVTANDNSSYFNVGKYDDEGDYFILFNSNIKKCELSFDKIFKLQELEKVSKFNISRIELWEFLNNNDKYIGN